MSDQLIAIRVLNRRCDFCASGVWLYSCRSDRWDKTNQMLQKYSGVSQVGAGYLGCMLPR